MTHWRLQLIDSDPQAANSAQGSSSCAHAGFEVALHPSHDPPPGPANVQPVPRALPRYLHAAGGSARPYVVLAMALCLGAALAQPIGLAEQQGYRRGPNGRALRPALRPAAPARRSGGLVALAGGRSAGDPPDVPRPRDGVRSSRGEWLQSILSRFGPVKEKASNTTVLDFEKPLVELDNRIREVRGRTTTGGRRPASGGGSSGGGVPLHARADPTHLMPPPQVRQVAEENGVDVSSQIKELEERAKQVGALMLRLRRVGGTRGSGATAAPTQAELVCMRLPAVPVCSSKHAEAPTAAQLAVAHGFGPVNAAGACPRFAGIPVAGLRAPERTLVPHPRLTLQLRKDTYSRLTPIQRLQVARHPNRPTFLDIALNISDKVGGRCRSWLC